MTSPEELSFEYERLKNEVKRLQSLSSQQAEKLGMLSAQVTAADKRVVALERERAREQHNADVAIDALKRQVHDLKSEAHGQLMLREAAEKRLGEAVPRFQVTPEEWADAVRESRNGEPLEWDHDTVFGYLNAVLAKRPVEPAPRITREQYDAAYQRAVDASVRGEATVKDALYRGLGVVEPAPRFHVTAEEMRQAVRQTCGAEHDEILWHELNVVLAKRPAEPAPLALPSREEIAMSLAHCLNPADEVEAVLRLLREHTSPADEAAQTEAKALEGRIGQLMQRVESLLAERDEARERNERLEVTSKALITDCKRLQGERDDGVAKHEAIAAEVRRKADEHRRQRDEARAHHADECDRARRQEARLDREIAELRAQLAARPEPVPETTEVPKTVAVIDETNANELDAAHKRYELFAGAVYWEIDRQLREGADLSKLQDILREHGGSRVPPSPSAKQAAWRDL